MLGFSPGRRHALMAGLAETGGGLLLALRFLTPVAAAVVFSVMLVAALSVHVKKGFFITRGVRVHARPGCRRVDGRVHGPGLAVSRRPGRIFGERRTLRRACVIRWYPLWGNPTHLAGAAPTP